MTRTQIGRWRLGEVLGEGGMGTVYLASHVTLETAAAAKMLSPKLSRDPRFRERFLREARAQAHLHHKVRGPIQILHLHPEQAVSRHFVLGGMR